MNTILQRITTDAQNEFELTLAREGFSILRRKDGHYQHPEVRLAWFAFQNGVIFSRRWFREQPEALAINLELTEGAS
jgi:hypothetical protein